MINNDIKKQSQAVELKQKREKAKQEYNNMENTLNRLENSYPDKEFDELFIDALKRNPETTGLAVSIEKLKDVNMSDVFSLICDENGNFINTTDAFALNMTVLKDVAEFGKNIPILSIEEDINPIKTAEVAKKNFVYNNNLDISAMLKEYHAVANLMTGQNPYSWTEKALNTEIAVQKHVHTPDIVESNRFKKFASGALNILRNILPTRTNPNMSLELKSINRDWGRRTHQYDLIINGKKLELTTEIYKYKYCEDGHVSFSLKGEDVEYSKLQGYGIILKDRVKHLKLFSKSLDKLNPAVMIFKDALKLIPAANKAYDKMIAAEKETARQAKEIEERKKCIKLLAIKNAVNTKAIGE